MPIKCIVGKEPVAKPSACIELEDTGKGSIAVILRDTATKCKVATIAKIGKRTAKITRMTSVPSKYGFDLDSLGRVRVI